MHIFKLKPVGKDYLWGGEKLKTGYNKNINLTPLAETWEFSSHPDGESIVDTGEFKGLTLSQVFVAHPELFGKRTRKFGDIPILVKFIDAKKKLSIQVHPDDKFAIENENQNGKTEMWYVLEAEKGAEIVYGFEHDVTSQKIIESAKDGSIEKHLHFEPVKKGDIFYIPAGMVHGIGAGVVVVEIQQNSNVTYRVYDYNRIDKDGKKRNLHIDKAVKVLNMKAFNGNHNQSKLIFASPGSFCEQLCKSDKFTVFKYSLKGKLKIDVENDDFDVILCLSGNGEIDNNGELLSFKKGDCIFVSNDYKEIMIYGDTEILKINY